MQTTRSPWAELSGQFTSFFGVGLIAAAVHYGSLIALVEIAGARPVPATLAGYAAGGLVSYILNRRLTYASDRPHREATWRFAVVSAVGFGLTWALMSFSAWLLGPRFGFFHVYFAAQLVTTGIVLFWSFLAHKLWTFADTASSPR
jgi:putative flippase GtrA